MKKPARDLRYCACDTETTGVRLFHDSQPFFASCYSPQGLKTWQWPVDPYTRNVNYFADCCRPSMSRPERVIANRKINTSQDVINCVGRYLDDFDLIIFHNAKFDLRALSHNQLLSSNIPWDRVHDTLLMSHVLDSQESHNLKDLALKYLDIMDDDEKALEVAVKKSRPVAKKLGWKIAHESWMGKGNTELWKADYWIPHTLDPKCDLVQKYGGRDAERTLKLFIVFRGALQAEGLWEQYEHERQLLPIVYGMEERGVQIDMQRIDEQSKKLKAHIEQSNKQVISIAKQHGFPDFNPASGAQLQKLLYGKLGCPVYKQTDKGSPSVDADSLKHIVAKRPTGTGGKVCSTLLAGRKSEAGLRYMEQYKALAVFHPAGAYTESGRQLYTIHSSFNQCGSTERTVGTTRFSSSKPNLQNVAKGEEEKGELTLRPIFKPRAGKFWYDIDYSKLELRLLAYCSRCKELIDAFGRGDDPMMLIAQEMFQDEFPKTDRRYKNTKNFVYRFAYGGGEQGGDDTLGMKGGSRRFGSRYPEFKDLMARCIEKANTIGYITTLFGYRLYVPKDRPYAALDYLIQGTAGGILKRGILNTVKFLQEHEERRVELVLTVHDENVWECSHDLLYTCSHYHNRMILQGIIEGMEKPGMDIGIPTPVEVDVVTSNWGSREEVEKSSLKAQATP